MADLNRMAAAVIRATVDHDKPKPVESVAQKNGRKGGMKGGKARASTLTAAQRSEIARTAAKARWAKRKAA
jgi:hypothetical protein